MVIKTGDLDTRICDLCYLPKNTETYREYIRNTEKKFDLQCRDVDNMDEEDLNDYLELLDSLWVSK